MRLLGRNAPLWVWWIPVVWIVSFPFKPTATPQWARVHAVPFSDPADKVENAAINLLMFVPFGALPLLRSGRPERSRDAL